MSHVYEDSPDGRVLEIENWRHHQPLRALAARYLTGDEQKRYLDLREAGVPDSGIWFALHPEWAAAREGEPSGCEQIALPVADLSREQVVSLLKMLLASKLSSLERASVDDLRTILKGLIGSEDVSIRL
ncbi:MAG: hypothetical protein ACYS9X_00070 [Planctomycetota bacterium]|jgi:hypothetical protein